MESPVAEHRTQSNLDGLQGLGKRKKTGLGDTQSGSCLPELENQLDSELDQTFRRGSSAADRRRDLTESVARCSTVKARCRGRKVRMVEEVEELRPELKADSFSDRRPLEHGEIKVVDSRCSENRIGTGL